MRPFLAVLVLLAGCAHTTPSPSPSAPPSPDATPSLPTASPAPPAGPIDDRFGPVRAAAEALLEAQGEATWKAWTTGEPADALAPWAGRDALLSVALTAQLGEAMATAPPPERARLERLRAFLLGEQLARAAAGPIHALAAARAGATFAWEKRTVPLRQLHALLAGEPEAPRRKAAAEAWRAALLKLEKLAAARDAALLQAGAERGLPSAPALAGALRLDDPDHLAALAERTLAAGDVAWPATLDALSRQELGLPAARLREHDLPRLLRTGGAPAGFPADQLIPAVTELLAGLGLDLSAGGRLTVDAALRPGKLPRPLAVPIAVPGQVRISLTPLAGLDAVRALLHEVGVGLSLVHVAPGAAFEDRRLPPAWHTQAWGLLFEAIASDPDWLQLRGLSPEAARREAGLGAARRTHATRAAAAAVIAEVGRARDPAGASARWAALAPRALGHPLDRDEPPPWRLEPDPQLRAADTLRAQLLAARLTEELRALDPGRPWWRSPAAGAWLRARWAEGGSWIPAPAPASSTPVTTRG